MPVIRIDNLDSEALRPYVSLTERSLRDTGIFIAESPKVIQRALEAGIEPVSFVCEEKHIEGDAAAIISSNPEVPVYTGTRELLSSLTGYVLTRGVLCAMKRPVSASSLTISEDARRLCVIYDVCDTTNVGVIFRSAAALGYDGIILSKETCNPLNRRSIRVSMGSVFQIPWKYSSDVVGELKEKKFQIISTDLNPESISLEDFPADRDGRYALVFGSEGYGIPKDIISSSDATVSIPMHNKVDSLNVGAAAAIILWHFRP